MAGKGRRAVNSYIGEGFFPFFLELQLHNNRDWFQENKERYEEEVRGPLLRLIEDFQEPLKGISPYYLAIPRKSGGSLFRINRDVRFGRDKSPYKTNAGIHFRHQAGKDVHAPGFYIHLSPEECFIGAGIWHPVGEDLKKIRTYIAQHSRQWTEALAGGEKGGLVPAGDSLKRPPRGFEADHPLIEDLKGKDFLISRNLTFKEVQSENLLTLLERDFQAAAPYMKLICDALGLPF